MERKKKTSKLDMPEVIEKITEWRNDGNSFRYIADKLNTEYGINVSIPTVSKAISNNTNKDLENKKDTINDTQSSAQDILYENRREAVRLRKLYKTNKEIATVFNVSEQDVSIFFSRRKPLTKEQMHEIVQRYEMGTSIEVLSLDYGTHKKTIQQLIEKALASKSTTSPLVSSKIAESNTNMTEIASPLTISPTVIKDFANFIKWAEVSYKNAQKTINDYDNKRNDIYHIIELTEVSDEKKLELVNEIQKISTNRREYKDYCELIEPFIEFISQEANRKLVSTLSNLASRISHKAEELNCRLYFKRDLEEER